MNRKILLVLVYHLFYALLTISFAAARDFGNELFGSSVYLNGIYLLLLPVNYATYLLLQWGFSAKPVQLLLFHFLSCLLVFDLLTRYLGDSLLSALFQDIAAGEWGSLLPLVQHIVFLVIAYTGAWFITRKHMTKRRPPLAGRLF